jgi:glycosyltransferase involved in cell wall biosynthesis
VQSNVNSLAIMRVLWLSAVFPLPLTDGNRHRHFHLMRGVARDNDVQLVCPVHDAERDLLPQLSAVGVKINPVPTTAAQIGRLRATVQHRPACLVPADIDGLAQAAAEIGPVDVAFGALSVAAAAARGRAPRLILDDQNVESDLYDRLWRTERFGPRKLARFHDWRLVRTYESRWVGAPEAVTVCSTRDLERLARRAPAQRFHVVPNGVDLDAVPFRAAQPESKMILFVGGMSWAPNVAGARMLVNEVMPLVWNEHPDAELCLVGKDPSPEVKGLARQAVTVTGEVPSVAPYLQRASVSVVPLESGGGTRLKILEAMAAGVPVVSTTIGAEGLGLRSGIEAILTDGAPDIAKAIIRILAHAETSRSIAFAARRRVQQDYGWDAIADRLKDVLRTSRLSLGASAS